MTEEELEPDPFGDWLAAYATARMDDSEWTVKDLEEAFDAGCNTGWDAATEYYGRGGSFK